MLRMFVALAFLLPCIEVHAQNSEQNTIYLYTKDGQIVIRLRADLAPRHAERIRTLAREKFYDNVPFHRVIDGYMAQTGDGQFGNGTGGSKYPNLPAEFSNMPFKRGIVGMARKGSDTNSANSQFFIMFAEAPSLNGQYTVIGEVVSGMDVVDKIKKGSQAQNGFVANPDKIVRMQVAAQGSASPTPPAAPGETLICLRPVFMEEMRLRDRIDGNRATTIWIAEAINYLTAKYCRSVAEQLQHDDSVQVKDNCFQYTGVFRAERVFWGRCDEQRMHHPTQQPSLHDPARPSRRKEALNSLVACCIAYCRAIGCNSPPLPKACDPARLASASYYTKRYFFDGARLGLGITVSACR